MLRPFQEGCACCARCKSIASFKKLHACCGVQYAVPRMEASIGHLKALQGQSVSDGFPPWPLQVKSKVPWMVLVAMPQVDVDDCSKYQKLMIMRGYNRLGCQSPVRLGCACEKVNLVISPAPGVDGGLVSARGFKFLRGPSLARNLDGRRGR